MKFKQKAGLSLVIGVVAIAVLLIVLKTFGTGVVDVVGFGLLIGLSFGALYK
ncbi:hypothetical protein EV586_104271 [Tumebacillus sp. BK434]|uniref:hypothetical protein n=1 Tax=Tumebacillus sp. BK434 TaxID=2512169 RepID=UPI0010DB56B0|nr:hypothetical protein [Tumebacillus sp. BK434]TCP54650.1 hypothetical protein EV586_104271 [Tumebacillus sp. BK434]